MFPLIYVMIGIIFIQIIFPILSSLSDLVLTWLEVKKLKLTAQAQKINQKLALEEMPPAHQIGFIYTEPEEEDDEDD